jgi:hypothetical protein
MAPLAEIALGFNAASLSQRCETSAKHFRSNDQRPRLRSFCRLADIVAVFCHRGVMKQMRIASMSASETAGGGTTSSQRSMLVMMVSSPRGANSGC